MGGVTVKKEDLLRILAHLKRFGNARGTRTAYVYASNGHLHIQAAQMNLAIAAIGDMQGVIKINSAFLGRLLTAMPHGDTLDVKLEATGLRFGSLSISGDYVDSAPEFPPKPKGSKAIKDPPTTTRTLDFRQDNPTNRQFLANSKEILDSLQKEKKILATSHTKNHDLIVQLSQSKISFTKHGDRDWIDLGWLQTYLKNGRPIRLQIFAMDQATHLNFFFPRQDSEELEATEVFRWLFESDLVANKDKTGPAPDADLRLFTDARGKEIWRGAIWILDEDTVNASVCGGFNAYDPCDPRVDRS